MGKENIFLPIFEIMEINDPKKKILCMSLLCTGTWTRTISFNNSKMKENVTKLLFTAKSKVLNSVLPPGQ